LPPGSRNTRCTEWSPERPLPRSRSAGGEEAARGCEATPCERGGCRGERRGRLAVGVLEGVVVADEPAAGGAEHDDVAAGGHGGDDAVAPRGLALQGVHGEELAAAAVHGRW